MMKTPEYRWIWMGERYINIFLVFSVIVLKTKYVITLKWSKVMPISLQQYQYLYVMLESGKR